MELDNNKRRNILHKEGDIDKIITQSSPAFILSSARESLKKLEMKKMNAPLPRKLVNTRKISIHKIDSPSSPNAQDQPEGLIITRAHSAAVDNLTRIEDHNMFLEDLSKLEIQRRATLEANELIQRKLERPDLKPPQANPAKNSTKAFIIKHKKNDSGEKRKASWSVSQPLETMKETTNLLHLKPSINDNMLEKRMANYTPETISEEKKSDVSSLTSNQTVRKDETISTKNDETQLYIISFDDTKGGTGTSTEFELPRPIEHKQRRDKNNIILKKDVQISFDVTLGEVLGEGAYGVVYKALNMETGNFIAVKEINMIDSLPKPTLNIGTLCQEIEVYQKLEHKNIVSYLGAKQEDDEIYIYMEYMPGGSISSMLKQYGSFEESVIKKFTKQVALGLDYLHTKGVIHRDIKGANILSDGDGNVKLADFGAAKHIDYLPFVASVSSSDMCASIKGSLYWMAPELLNQQKHGRKIDIWSLGCTVIEMATASHPWQNIKSYPELVIAMMLHKCPPIPEHLSEHGKDFIRQCCQFDKKLRPRIKDLLQHPFIKDS